MPRQHISPQGADLRNFSVKIAQEKLLPYPLGKREEDWAGSRADVFGQGSKRAQGKKVHRVCALWGLWEVKETAELGED